MFRTAATIRISTTLASITLCALMSAMTLGLLPDRAGAIADGRVALCEALTVSCSLAIARGDRQTVKTTLESVAFWNPEIISMALRRNNGTIYTAVGDHEQERQAAALQSTLTHMYVPVQLAGRP